VLDPANYGSLTITHAVSIEGHGWASIAPVSDSPAITINANVERRTACLQANVEFLQQALIKLARETQEKISTADRDLSTARAEIAGLKSTMEKLNSELAQMKVKAESDNKK
jgi:hypothetical protein